MRITFLTIFPESFSSFLSYPVIRRAVKNGLVDIGIVDIKEHADGCFRAIDDSPYGGGAGLLLRTDTLSAALASVKSPSSRTILLGPKGKRFSQKMAHELAGEEHIILIAGHYEGVDERFRSYVDDEISIGDYILTGGETAAITVAEAVIRLLDGALREPSPKEESFEDGILEHPQYTHPATFEGKSVPDILLRGDKERIALFNETEAIKDTIRLRPDLLKENRDFPHLSLHKGYGNEKDIIRWLGSRLPLPEIIYDDEDYLILSKQKGKPLSFSARNKILNTSAYILKRLWSLDTSGCPCDESISSTISKLRRSKLGYEDWNKLKELERQRIKEEPVFSHGSLRLGSILANGNGLSGLVNLQRAGTADRYRDLASFIPSLEQAGIERDELADILGIKIDDEKLAFFSALADLERKASLQISYTDN